MTATAGSRGPSFPAATPISPASTATTTSRSPRPISTSRPAHWPRRPARWCFRGSIATAAARSRATSSTRSFEATDSGGQGFLSLSDLQEAFTPPPASARPSPAAGRPSKATLVRGLFRQEIGSLQPGPKLDESAPDFTLKTNDGKAEVTLSKLVGPKPVVLVFGSFTCGPFRSHSGNIEKLYRRYKDRATFVMVYVREAHPTDGWRMESNDRVGAITAQPKSYEERADVAQKCGQLFNIGFPMLVDTIDDTVGARYSGMPGRLYLIDRDGKVAFKSGRGPYLFKPAELEQSLVLLLQEDGTANSSKAHVSVRGESTGREGDSQPSRLVREQAGARSALMIVGSLANRECLDRGESRCRCARH